MAVTVEACPYCGQPTLWVPYGNDDVWVRLTPTPGGHYALGGAGAHSGQDTSTDAPRYARHECPDGTVLPPALASER